MSYKRVLVTEFGGPEVLEVVYEPKLPVPAPGEVRIRVLASSATFTDVLVRKGIYPGLKVKPPFTPGYDMVGVVDKVGQEVTGFAEGDRVAELTIAGSYSEYICLPADRLVRVPETVDPAEAVSLVLSYVTAYQMLNRKAGVQEGQRILVHGAGGAVGSALLDIGQNMQLEMFGTASPGKHELVYDLGAVPIDYKSEDFVSRVGEMTGDGVDAVFDGIGGKHFSRSFKTLRKRGTMVAYGFYDAGLGRGGGVVSSFAKILWLKLSPNGRRASFYSIAPMRDKRPDWFSADLGALMNMLSEGRIRPRIDRRMSLEQAAEAHDLVERAAVNGRIVLETGNA